MCFGWFILITLRPKNNFKIPPGEPNSKINKSGIKKSGNGVKMTPMAQMNTFLGMFMVW